MMKLGTTVNNVTEMVVLLVNDTVFVKLADVE